MGFFDLPSASGGQAPAKGGTGFFDTPLKASTPTPQTYIPTSTVPSPKYFVGSDADGTSYGPSSSLDSSGRPFLDYRQSKDTATTTDKTRVIPTFDPRIATTTPQGSITTPRSVPLGTKQAMGGTKSTQLDHSIPLELSGSNDSSNLRLEPTVKGVNTATDPIENDLAQKVASGKMSLFYAQTQLAKVKGIKEPFTGQSHHQSWMDQFTGKVSSLMNTVTGFFDQPTPPTPEGDPFAGQTIGERNPKNIPYKAPTGLNAVFPNSSDMNPTQARDNINIKIPFTADRYASLPNVFQGVTGNSSQPNPIVETIANIPSSIAQAPTKFALTGSEELIHQGEMGSIPLTPFQQKLYGEKEYTPVNKDIQKRIDRGDGILSAYIGGISSKALDVAFGAQIMAQGARALATTLAKGGDPAVIEAYKTLGSPKNEVEATANYQKLVKQFTPDPANPGGGNPEAYNAVNKARSILDKEGLPTVIDKAKIIGSKYSEVVGRETPLGKKGFFDADIKPKDQVQGKPLGLKALPGTRPVNPDMPSLGLSTKAVEDVGKDSVVDRIVATKDVSQVESILKEINYPQTEISKIAPLLANSTTVRGVKGILEGFDKPVRKPQALPPALEEKATALELKKEVLDNSPFNKPDNKSMIDKEGRVKELGDVKNPKLVQKIEDRMAEAGINDPREYAQGLEKFFTRKADLIKKEAALKEEIRTMRMTSSEYDRAKAHAKLNMKMEERDINSKSSLRNLPQENHTRQRDQVYNDLPTSHKISVQKTTQQALVQLPSATSPKSFSLPSNTIQGTKSKVELKITGTTEKQRVQSAIVNSERIKNELSIKGKEAVAQGQGLSAKDIKLAEGYEHGTPIETLAKKADNPAKFTSFVQKMAEYYDFRLAADRAAGGSTKRVGNYIPHSWDLSKPEDLAKFNDLATQRGLLPYDGFHSQPRVFKTYAEGESLGFKRVNPTLLGDIKNDYGAASTIISRQALKQGLHTAAPRSVSMSGAGKTDTGKPFINSNLPGLEGISYHPNIHNMLKGYEPLHNQDAITLMKQKGFNPLDPKTFEKGWEGLKEAGILNTVGTLYDRVNKPMKHFLLNFSGFHSINISANFAGASIFDPKNGIKGLTTSIPSFFSEKVTQKVIEGFKDKTVEGKDYSVFDAGLRSGVNMDRSLPATGASVFNPMSALSRAMFDRELYTLKLNLVDQVFGNGKVSPESPKGRALAKEVNMIMGEMNNHTMNINPNTQKWLSRVLLAPQFTESKYKLIADAVTGWGKDGAGSQAFKAVLGKSLIMGFLSTFGTLLFTGKFPNLQQTFANFTYAPTSQTNITNPKGQKQDIGFPQTFVSEPGKPLWGLAKGSTDELTHYGQARLSPALSKALSIYTNKDYYGNPIVDPKSPDSTLKQLGSNLGVSTLPIGVQNIIKQLQGKQNTAQTAINIVGLRTSTHKDPGDQSTIDAATAAFNDQSKNQTLLKRQATDEINKLNASQDPAGDFEKIISSNPTLAKEIIKVKEKQDLGFTSKDYAIDKLGIVNGERAKFLVGEFNKLKTDEEKAKLWDDLVKKKIITTKVSEQMKGLITN